MCVWVIQVCSRDIIYNSAVSRVWVWVIQVWLLWLYMNYHQLMKRPTASSSQTFIQSIHFNVLLLSSLPFSPLSLPPRLAPLVPVATLLCHVTFSFPLPSPHPYLPPLHYQLTLLSSLPSSSLPCHLTFSPYLHLHYATLLPTSLPPFLQPLPTIPPPSLPGQYRTLPLISALYIISSSYNLFFLFLPLLPPPPPPSSMKRWITCTHKSAILFVASPSCHGNERGGEMRGCEGKGEGKMVIEGNWAI